jgi:hypothetical protein
MSPESNGIGLLVYCVRSVRVSRALLRNYNLFYSAICRKKVPIVIVITGLENQEPTMDSWWDTNGKEFKKCGMHFEDHACVTTLREDSNIPDIFTQRITESRKNLRRLILNNCTEWAVDDSWFRMSLANIRSMISDERSEKSSPPTLVICDLSRKELQVEIAFCINSTVQTCCAQIGGVVFQVHCVNKSGSNSKPTSSVKERPEADLLIYYAREDEQSTAFQRFKAFCAAYNANMVPLIVVVSGLNDSKAARRWVEEHLTEKGVGRPFSTFAPAIVTKDDPMKRKAEQELQELIQRSYLIRSEGRSEVVQKSIANLWGRWL